jgi:hypothetical protein
VWAVIHKDLVVVTGVRLKFFELSCSSVVMAACGARGFADLVQPVRRCSIMDDEFAGIGCATPDNHCVGGRVSEHRAVRQSVRITFGVNSRGRQHDETQSR